MKKYRIYPIIILAILLLSMLLPSYYAKIFAKRVGYSSIDYSPVLERFLKTSVDKDRKLKYSEMNDTKTYTFEEYEVNFPFIYYYDLITNDRFPQKFISYGQDIRAIRSEKSFNRLKTSAIVAKRVELYPLIESSPKRGGLKYPKDLFRLGKNGMTFIKTDSLLIDKDKNKKYNDILLRLGASFPLKKAYGNPSLMKSFDEGYFITDSKGQLFHVKRVQNEPKISKIDTKGIQIRYMLAQENSRKEYYGIVLDTNSNIYLLMYGDYELVKLPTDGYDYKKDRFELDTTPINRVVNTIRRDYDAQTKTLNAFVTNLDYELMQKEHFSYSTKHTPLYENIREALFPFQIYITNAAKPYYYFKIMRFNLLAFAISFALGVLYLIYIKSTKKAIKDYIPQAILIAVAGVYSLIALALFDKLLPTKGKPNETAK